MADLSTDVLVVGSGAGGAITAAALAAAGRTVTVVEEGPWVDADALEPFSLDEMVAKYRHHGLAAALGSPAIAYAEGRCVGGSTEINSGLYHRLPDDLALEWRSTYGIDEFTPEALHGYADRVEHELSVAPLPGAPPPSSAALERGATKLGWRNVEFARVFRYDQHGRGTKQTMSRTMLPKAVAAGATVIPDCRVLRLLRRGDRIVGARCRRTHPGGGVERLTSAADHVFVCGGAIHTPALLQRSGIWRNVGNGLKMHPTIKIAARFPHPVDHGDVPMHRITEFSPFVAIGGSASRRGHVALALADTGAPFDEALADWENISVYYAAIRSDGSGPGGRPAGGPLAARDLLAHRGRPEPAGPRPGPPGRAAAGGRGHRAAPVASWAAPVVRRLDEIGAWWDQVTRARANLMTVHLTSTVRMGENRTRTGADSFGRVWGYRNLRVNDASLLPDAPGVNPQAAIMAIATRNCDHFLAEQ